MDQNLEPKVDPPEIKIKVKRQTPKQSGYYLMGDTSPRSFIGYIKRGAWNEKQIQEYIEVQKRLAPDCVKERERAARTPVEDKNTKVEASSSTATGRTRSTPRPAEQKKESKVAKFFRWRSPKLLDEIPETDDEA